MGTGCLSPEPGTGSPRTHLLLCIWAPRKAATIACQCKVNLTPQFNFDSQLRSPSAPPAPLYSPSIKQRCHSCLSADSFRTPPRRRAPEIIFVLTFLPTILSTLNFNLGRDTGDILGLPMQPSSKPASHSQRRAGIRFQDTDFATPRSCRVNFAFHHTGVLGSLPLSSCR